MSELQSIVLIGTGALVALAPFFTGVTFAFRLMSVLKEKDEE